MFSGSIERVYWERKSQNRSLLIFFLESTFIIIKRLLGKMIMFNGETLDSSTAILRCSTELGRFRKINTIMEL